MNIIAEFIALAAFAAMVGSWLVMAAGTAGLAMVDLWELWGPIRHSWPLTR